jgi:hypothetical protein
VDLNEISGGVASLLDRELARSQVVLRTELAKGLPPVRWRSRSTGAAGAIKRQDSIDAAEREQMQAGLFYRQFKWPTLTFT